MNTLAPLDLVSLITVLLAMVILAVISRLYNRSWLEPGSFFLVVWFGFIFLPLIVAPENPIYPVSIWYIFSFAVAILLGSAVWNKVDPATRLGKALTMGVPLDRYANILFNFTLVFTAISIVGVGVLIFSGMWRYNLTFDLFSLSSLPNLFYVDRDTGIFTLSWIVKGLMYLVYTTALLGGITYRLLEEWKRYFCFFPLLIALLYGLTLAVRSGIILSIILWCSGWCGAKVYMKDQTFKIKTVGLAVISLIFFVFIFISVSWLRSGADDPFFIMAMVDNARINYFGHLTAFSNWFNGYQYKSLAFGSNTFSGPLDLLGVIDRKIGFYEEYIYLSGRGYTNIFTFFRGLVEDFSIPGTLMAGFGVGMLARLAFNRCSYGHFLWMIPLTLYYAFILYSPIISLFNYNSAIMAWIITSIPLILIRKKLIL
jgi:oligosaccharide repeat unit polymerase